MSRRWIHEIHDPILIDLVTKWKRPDRACGDEMGFDPATIKLHRKRLNLPENTRPPAPPYYGIEPPLPKEKPNPINVAIRTLGDRLVEKPSGYWLDGRPVGLVALMRETNRVRAGMALDQIGPDSWRV